MTVFNSIPEDKVFSAVVMGVSAGGLAALNAILPALSAEIDLPVIIVQHLSPDSDDFLVQYFEKEMSIKHTHLRPME